jgi:hypothetical protein
MQASNVCSIVVIQILFGPRQDGEEETQVKAAILIVGDVGITYSYASEGIAQ